jgi:CheY-like chemotaxis protein
VSVVVADTGVGIAAEHVPMIFDEFFQLRNPERDRHKGTGLGLAICKRLVDAMGGAITVDSTPGKGSAFTVTLPRSAFVPGASSARTASTSASTDPAAKPPLQDDATLSGVSILLVEDHDSTRIATAQILQDYGAQVFQAPNGKAGLDLLKREKPQVLLLDLMLPDMDGRDVLRTFGSARPDHLTRVLVLTGNLINTSEGELKALGADAVCPKPIDVRCLIEAIAEKPGPR